MNKKRILIAIICIALAVLLICSLFVAAGFAFANADDFQFGGLVGELLAGKDQPLSDSEAASTEQESTTEHQTSSTTEQLTDQAEPQPNGTPMLRFMLGGCESWIQYNEIQSFFEPGKASEWDHRAVIDDYKVEYVRIWGWAALFEEVPLQLGYKIDGGESVYDDTAEFYAPAQSSTTAALGMGAVSAIGMRVKIPVEYLSGVHTVDIVVRPLGGKEGVISTFEIEKAEPPYVFMADAAYLASMLENGNSRGIESFIYFSSRYPKESYVHIYPIANFLFPTLNVCPYNGQTYSTDARYLAIKCHKYGPDSATVNVSSDLPQYEDSVQITYDNEWWQLIIIDLAQVSPIAINGSYDITHLDFVFFHSPADAEDYCSIAWIATFKTVEDAQQYDADHPYAKG